MDQDATWYGGRYQPRPHCIRWGPAPPQKGHCSTRVQPTTIVAKRLPISVSTEHLLHSSRQEVPILYNGRPFPKNCPFPWEDLDPHLMYDFLGPSESTTQIATWSVQPFLHRWPYSVPIIYNGNPFSTQKLSLPWGIWTASNTWFPWPIQVLTQNGIMIGSAVLAGLTSVTDRPTDHTTWSVRIGRICVRSIETLTCFNKMINRNCKHTTTKTHVLKCSFNKTKNKIANTATLP